jgi:hypothetical protein
MNITIKAKDASAETTTRSRYARIAVTAVHSWETSGAVITLGPVVPP